MQYETWFETFKSIFKKRDVCEDMELAGTGFMYSLTEGIHKLQDRGYTANFVPKYDHLEANMGQVKLYPTEFIVEKMYRFENASDPDDQSILYAVSSLDKRIKGLYVDSYGAYHDELSTDMIQCLVHRCRW